MLCRGKSLRDLSRRDRLSECEGQVVTDVLLGGLAALLWEQTLGTENTLLGGSSLQSVAVCVHSTGKVRNVN